MHERQAIKKRVKSLLEGIWLSFYCYPATTGYLFLIISDQQFIDRFFKGKTHTEIAEELNLSVKSVNRYKQKTLEFLRNELKEYMPLLLLFISR